MHLDIGKGDAKKLTTNVVEGDSTLLYIACVRGVESASAVNGLGVEGREQVFGIGAHNDRLSRFLTGETGGVSVTLERGSKLIAFRAGLCDVERILLPSRKFITQEARGVSTISTKFSVRLTASFVSLTSLLIGATESATGDIK
jgi:hypothetical protein